MAMRDEDIYAHTHRMYLVGDNSIKHPWYLPSDFPNSALDTQDRDKLLALIKEKQSVVDWSLLQKDTYFFSRILCPPLADLVHKCFRKRHFNSM